VSTAALLPSGVAADGDGKSKPSEAKENRTNPILGFERLNEVNARKTSKTAKRLTAGLYM
jgi:hypothetical protein